MDVEGGERMGNSNGTYEDTLYNENIGNSVKSKVPTDGQEALDDSIPLREN